MAQALGLLCLLFGVALGDWNPPPGPASRNRRREDVPTHEFVFMKRPPGVVDGEVPRWRTHGGAPLALKGPPTIRPDVAAARALARDVADNPDLAPAWRNYSEHGEEGPLPAGWEERFDSEARRRYYWHNETKLATWRRPDPPKQPKVRPPTYYGTLPKEAVADLLFGSAYPLRDGQRLPVLGLGLGGMRPGKTARDAMLAAVSQGYRYIDTAPVDGHRDLGSTIGHSGVPREELAIASKLTDNNHGFDKALVALNNTLRTLGLDYLDLYLILSPTGGKIVETWDALVHARNSGLVRSIGVSNFGIRHLKVLEKHGRERPVVNQLEMHPKIFRERRKLLEYCASKGILVTAYGSLFAGRQLQVQSKQIQAIAARHGKTCPQVLLRWGLQKGVQLIPRSKSPARQRENADIFDFELSDADMRVLDARWMYGRLGAYRSHLLNEDLHNPDMVTVDVGDLTRATPSHTGYPQQLQGRQPRLSAEQAQPRQQRAGHGPNETLRAHLQWRPSSDEQRRPLDRPDVFVWP